MAVLESYDATTITFKASHDAAMIITDAFRHDAVKLALIPGSDRFTDAKIPPLFEYKRLLEVARDFKRLVAGTALSIHRLEPGSRLFLLRDEAGEAVGASLWNLPKYVKVPRLSVFHRLKNLLFSAYSVIWRWLHPAPYSVRPIIEQFEWAGKNTGVTDESGEQAAALEKLDADALRKVIYPKNLAYYLDLFVIRTDQHGKGWGRELMDKSISELRMVPPPQLARGAPAKVVLQAAPTARGFYEHYGFSAGGHATRKLDSGVVLEHTSYFLNVD